MRLRSALAVAVPIVLGIWIARVESTVRINGNQMVEGALYHAQDGSEGAPSIVVHNLGQAVLPTATLPDSSSGVSFGVGLAYDIGSVVYNVLACPIALTGDVNVSGSLTSSDIIAMVNYTFKGGDPPLPCEAAADVNGSGSVTSADIIYMVNHVFKGDVPPVDVCGLIPGTWTCR